MAKVKEVNYWEVTLSFGPHYLRIPKTVIRTLIVLVAWGTLPVLAFFIGRSSISSPTSVTAQAPEATPTEEVEPTSTPDPTQVKDLADAKSYLISKGYTLQEVQDEYSKIVDFYQSWRNKHQNDEHFCADCEEQPDQYAKGEHIRVLWACEAMPADGVDGSFEDEDYIQIAENMKKHYHEMAELHRIAILWRDGLDEDKEEAYQELVKLDDEPLDVDRSLVGAYYLEEYYIGHRGYDDKHTKEVHNLLYGEIGYSYLHAIKSEGAVKEDCSICDESPEGEKESALIEKKYQKSVKLVRAKYLVAPFLPETTKILSSLGISKQELNNTIGKKYE